jgi:hypothetical protein
VSTTDSLHPARLLVSAALTSAEFSKKFKPKIEHSILTAGQLGRYRATGAQTARNAV